MHLPVLVILVLCSQAQQCMEMYKTAFGKQGNASPKAVGDLVFAYCKTNLKLSSAKSMDELCRPMVRKAEDKMRHFPPNEVVTPELACKSVEELAELFPAHHRAMLEEQERERASPATLVEQEAGALRDALKQSAEKELASWKQGMDREIQARMKSLSAKFDMAIQAAVQNFTRVVRNEFKKQRESKVEL
mmetsp:Transcript_36404/g.79496  ORF Transcript_36404/g.79496 Transcript_36404/m.79496 type:complete len:190 (+) Transcript_36404:915-1484(+)